MTTGATTAGRDMSPRASGLPGRALLVVCLIAMPLAAAAAKRPMLPKGVVAVAHGEGRFDLTATVTAEPPSEGEVARLGPRERMEQAASRLCPQGYRLDADDHATLRVDASGRFVAKLRGVATCSVVQPPAR